MFLGGSQQCHGARRIYPISPLAIDQTYTKKSELKT
jgi:hypothetical protein